MPKKQFDLYNDPLEIKELIEALGLKCWIVRGTGMVQLGLSDNRDHMDEISVDEFIDSLRERGLAVYFYPPSNFVKIMKAPRGKGISYDWGEEDF